MLVLPVWGEVSWLERVLLQLYFADKGMFPIRMFSPLIAIGIAGYYFLPETSGNILALARRVEDRVPVLKDVHDRVTKEYDDLRQGTLKEAEIVSDKLGISKK